MTEEKKTLLDRVTTALHDGQVARTQDRSTLADAVKETTENHDRETLMQVLDRASGRNMLVRDKVENRYGEEIEVELSEVKEREPYQKRPATRALKQSGRGRIGR